MAPPAARGISSWLAQPFPPTATVVWSEPGSLLEQQPLRAERHVPLQKGPHAPGLVPCRGWGGLPGGPHLGRGDYGLTLFLRLPQVPGLAFLLRFWHMQSRVRESV